jgi:hypothetical protein
LDKVGKNNGGIVLSVIVPAQSRYYLGAGLISFPVDFREKKSTGTLLCVLASTRGGAFLRAFPELLLSGFDQAARSALFERAKHK